MSERYKPRALYREARARPFTPTATPPPIIIGTFTKRTDLRGARWIVDCKHGQPWTSRNLCSTVKGKKL